MRNAYSNRDESGRRLGKPLTDAERRVRHKRLYGTSKLPKRGTGLLAEASKLVK